MRGELEEKRGRGGGRCAASAKPPAPPSTMRRVESHRRLAAQITGTELVSGLSVRFGKRRVGAPRPPTSLWRTWSARFGSSLAKASRAGSQRSAGRSRSVMRRGRTIGSSTSRSARRRYSSMLSVPLVTRGADPRRYQCAHAPSARVHQKNQCVCSPGSPIRSRGPSSGHARIRQFEEACGPVAQSLRSQSGHHLEHVYGGAASNSS